VARNVRNPKIDTRSARAKLAQRREPYWTSIQPGFSIGYRKGATGGTWIAKRYDAAATPARLLHALGTADDNLDADGVTSLSFVQAQARARDWHDVEVKKIHGEEPVSTATYTVGNALDAYLAKLEAEGKASAREARYRAEAARPALGKVELRRLTADRLRKWLNDTADAPRRVRVKKGAEAKHLAEAITDDQRRARRSTANRAWAVIRAALNQAFADGKAITDAPWRRVKPFRGVDAARVRYLTVEEAMRLVNASFVEFRNLVTAALVTGARYSELGRVDVSDWMPDAGTILVRQSKAGKHRHIYVNDEGRAFFDQITAGRPGSAIMLPKTDGNRWAPYEQSRPMRATVLAGEIDPPIGFHGLRHTYASLAVMNGAPLQVVAHNLGHTTTRMVEKHYGHLAPSYVAETIRRTAPTFGLEGKSKVTKLRRGRAA
jgi:integrase